MIRVCIGNDTAIEAISSSSIQNRCKILKQDHQLISDRLATKCISAQNLSIQDYKTICYTSISDRHARRQLVGDKGLLVQGLL